MAELPSKTRHYPVIDEFLNEHSEQVSEDVMVRKAAAMLLLQDVFQARPSRPRLISSTEGALTKMLLTLPHYALKGKDNPVWATMQDLILKFPAETSFILVTHASTENQLKQWCDHKGISQRATLVPIPDHFKLSIWAEDPFVVAKDVETGEHTLMEPHSFYRRDDAMIAYFVSQATDFHFHKCPVYFEGGNILVGDDFILLGADYPVASLVHLADFLVPEAGETKADLVHRMYRQYFGKNRKLLYIGSKIRIPSGGSKKFTKDGETWKELYLQNNEKGTVQPLFHLDMFLTLAGRGPDGKYRVLVGDSRLGAKMLGHPVSPYAMAEAFDDMADTLRHLGFAVIRNPLPLVYLDDPEEKERIWYFASSNNALLEIRDEQAKTVYLPTYGHGDWKELQKTDEANKQIWEELGFTVVMLGDFHPFAEHSGSLHCIVRYLERG
jgi:hypothetical protein